MVQWQAKYPAPIWIEPLSPHDEMDPLVGFLSSSDDWETFTGILDLAKSRYASFEAEIEAVLEARRDPLWKLRALAKAGFEPGLTST